MYKCEASYQHNFVKNNGKVGGVGGHNRPCLHSGSHKMQFLNFLCLYTTHLTVQKIFLICIYPT